VVSLQERDFLILKWILEMRFSNLEMVNDGFFSESSPSMATARSRIKKLLDDGYLKKVNGYDQTTKAYYVSTKKSYKTLLEKNPDKIIPSPVKEISVQTFEHDKRVLECRLILEKQGRATHWISERGLKAILAERSQKIDKEFLPDAIFTSSIGLRCAFEFELSPKTSKRYFHKVERFKEVMEEKEGLFSLCLFVVSSEFTYKTLKQLTEPYGNRFKVQRYGELVSGRQ
jgi:hypothetical protein